MYLQNSSSNWGLVSWFGPFLYCKAVICIANWYIHHCSPMYCGMHQLCSAYNGGHSHHYWTGVWTKMQKDNQPKQNFVKASKPTNQKGGIFLLLLYHIFKISSSRDWIWSALVRVSGQRSWFTLGSEKSDVRSGIINCSTTHKVAHRAQYDVRQLLFLPKI